MSFRSFLAGLLGGGPPPAPSPEPPAPAPIDPALVDELRTTLRRRAIRMEIGGFRPPEGMAGSWFGRVNLALPGEGWPESDAQPLHALAQIDLTELPFRPPHLEDVALITVFIADEPAWDGEPNGDGWCLRAYPDLSRLVPLAPVDTGSRINPFPMRPAVIEDDYPSWEDVPDPVAARIGDPYFDLFHTAEGFKLGGWPYLVQSEIAWPEGEGHPAAPAYVFQIDSSFEADWMWGDAGMGYFGRGTAPGETHRWALAWQCH